MEPHPAPRSPASALAPVGLAAHRDGILLVGLCLLALLLRIPQLSASFYGDETFSLFRDSEQLLTPTEDRFRPLFFSLLYLWKQLGFHGEVGLRALPLSFGVLQVAVGFRLGRLLAGLRGGLVFGGLLALSPLLIEFSQELRMYSLVPLVALVQALALARLCEEPSARAWRYWAMFVLAGTAGVYSHFHYWFLNVGFAVALLRRRGTLPLHKSALALAVLALLYLPNVPNLLRFQSEAASAPHLTATDLPGALPKLLAAFTLGFNYFALPSMGIERAIGASTVRDNAVLALVALVPFALVAFRLALLHRQRPWGPVLWMAHELFTIPVLVSFVAVIVMKRNFIHPKYMVFCAPFWLLFFVAGALALRSKWERWLASGAALVVCVIALAHFNDPRNYGRREDYRGLSTLLRSQLKPGAQVLWLGSPAGPMVRNARPSSIWEYYGADLLPYVEVVPRSSASAAQVDAEIGALVAAKQDVHLVWLEIARNTVDPADDVLRSLRQRLGQPQVTQLNPRLLVYRWGPPNEGEPR